MTTVLELARMQAQIVSLHPPLKKTAGFVFTLESKRADLTAALQQLWSVISSSINPPEQVYVECAVMQWELFCNNGEALIFLLEDQKTGQLLVNLRCLFIYTIDPRPYYPSYDVAEDAIAKWRKCPRQGMHERLKATMLVSEEERSSFLSSYDCRGLNLPPSVREEQVGIVR